MTTLREAAQMALEAMKYADACLKKQLTTKTKHEYAQDLLMEAGTALIAALAQQDEQGPVAWLDEIEQRLLTWRQSFVNRSGDQLALDDFMDKRSLDDLIDFVCDRYAGHPPRASTHGGTQSTQDRYANKLQADVDDTPITPFGGLSTYREWQGLTDEDLSVCDEDGVLLARYWEAKLKSRNS